MQTMLPFLVVLALVGVLAPPSASATPLTLQYIVTVTRLCDFETGSCSDVNIGGIKLTVTTDDAVDRLEPQPFSSRAYFGPTTLAMDTSSLGSFANPFVPGSVFSDVISWTQDVDFGDGASLGVLFRTRDLSVLSATTRTWGTGCSRCYVTVGPTRPTAFRWTRLQLIYTPLSRRICCSSTNSLQSRVSTTTRVCTTRAPLTRSAPPCSTGRSRLFPSRRRSRWSARSSSSAPLRAECDAPECKRAASTAHTSSWKCAIMVARDESGVHF